MSDLKPCPFCGGTNLKHLDCGVFCMNTKCEGGVDFGHFLGGDDNESARCKRVVAEAWNQRVDDQRFERLEAENERLRDLCRQAYALIDDEWENLTDDEGYGPCNLHRRLKQESAPDE